jgi:hypothetical protein
MAQLTRTARTLSRLTATGAELADAALKAGECAVAAGTVIGQRVALGAQALQDPMSADASEFSRMGTEKLAAFAASSQAVLGELQSIQTEAMKFAIDQAETCMRAAWDVVTAFSPHQALAAQRRWTAESLARANSHVLRMAALSAGISGLALAPVHATVTANARRLSRPAKPR